MAKDETKRLNPDILQADYDSLAALKILPNYTPVNQDFTVARLETAKTLIDTTGQAEVAAEAVAKATRDDAAAAEWAFHNAVLNAKDQVAAQYGKDSNEYQSLGLKKKSEYKKPGRKAA